MSEQKLDLHSLDETARFFKVSLPTVRGWIAEGCPVHTKGGNGVAYELDVRAVHAWRQARIDAEQLAAEEKAARDQQLRLELLGSDALSGEDEAALSASAQAAVLNAEYTRTKLAALRRELVAAGDVKLMMVKVFADCRTRLRGLPDALGDEFGLSESQQETMLQRIDDTLDEIADAIERIGAAPAEAA